MKVKLTFLFLLSLAFSYSQNVTLYQQFSGHVDFTMIGNTLNPQDNSINNSCTILTSSMATLNLDVNDQIEAAYLYWSGSGSGDFEVLLNGQDILAERTFSQLVAGNPVFGAFTDITTQVQNTGNGNYTLSELDLTMAIPNYCANQTNYGGWAILVFYNNDILPLNQINFYDGMQSVIPNQGVTNLTINLENLFVIDNLDSKIGFLAWEGDQGLAIEETLEINNLLVSNPPLNPSDNVFNGTNSFTNSSELHNMDLDVYNIENFINVGDTSVNVKLSSGQDFVMINAVAVKLSVQLPDAIVTIDSFELLNCNLREVAINFTVTNLELAILPINTPVSIYADGLLIATFLTTIPLINQETTVFNEIINIPNNVPNDFMLTIVVDDDGLGNSTVSETNEFNNQDQMAIVQFEIPTAHFVPNLSLCDQEIDANIPTALFDTSQIDNIILGGVGMQPNMEIIYFSQNGNTLPSPLPNPFTTTSQTLTAIVQNPLNKDCNNTTTIVFEVIPLPNFDVFNADLCLNFLPEPLIISIENQQDNYNYQWLNENNIIVGSNSNQLEITQSGIYSVIATTQDDLACATTKTFEITQTEIIISQPENILECDKGFNTAIFNLEQNINQITTDNALEINFFITENDAIANTNEIAIPSQYQNIEDPQTIYVRIENIATNCFETTRFILETEDCFPEIPNAFTPNNDNQNETFTINGLHDIFLDFKMEIFNRYGNLIYSGNNNTADWNGKYKGNNLPVGTYFYYLYFNDKDGLYSPISGWIYLNR